MYPGVTELILLAAAFIAFMYVVAPIIVRAKFSISAQPAPELVAVDDPRVPPSVRAFFTDVGAELQPLGFSAAAHVLVPRSTPDTTGYVAVFEKGTTGEQAAAMAFCSRVSAMITRHDFVVEFCTDFADQSSAETNNACQPAAHPPAPWRQTWRFPAMADLAQLYECHRQHIAPRIGDPRRPVPPGSTHATRLRDGMIRDLQAAQNAGYMYLDEISQVFRQTWKGAYLAVWGMLWPAGAIRRWRLRCRARSILRELNLPVRYETVNPRRWTTYGDAGWSQTLVAPAPPPVQGPAPGAAPVIVADVVRHSGSGIASFVMSLALGAIQLMLLCIGIVIASQRPEQSEPPLAFGLIGLGLLAACALNVVGLVLGIVGLIQRDRKHVFAVLGTCFNALVLLAVGALALLAR